MPTGKPESRVLAYSTANGSLVLENFRCQPNNRYSYILMSTQFVAIECTLVSMRYNI